MSLLLLFLIASHANYLSEMHGFRDNEVINYLAPPVIAGGAKCNFLITDSERATQIVYQCCILTTRIS